MAKKPFVPPAHLSLAPRLLEFIPVTDYGWLRSALPKLGISSARIAEGSIYEKIGNYRLETEDGNAYFAKVKSPERARKEAKAAYVSAQLMGSDVPALGLVEQPVTLPEGEVVFVYPWLTHNFFPNTEAALISLGMSLSKMHVSMLNLPTDADAHVHIIKLFRANISALKGSIFFDEANTAISQIEGALLPYPQQMAHNDLHVGNVLFQHDKVIGFVDFEDAVDIISSPILDLAACIERFAFLSLSPLPAAKVLLSAYSKDTDPASPDYLKHITLAGLCRCYHALGILAHSSAHTDDRWRQEWNKFTQLVSMWKDWGNTFSKSI